MAYALRFDGADDRVLVNKDISFNDITFIWTGAFSSLDVDNGVFQWFPNDTAQTSIVAWHDDPNGVTVQIKTGVTGNSVTSAGVSGLSAGVIYRIEVRVRNSVSIDVNVYEDDNGTLVGSTSDPLSASYDDVASFYIGDGQLARPFKGDLYSFEITGNPKFTPDFYDPSLSNGTGSTLPTVSGSNQGTLNNFPTDDSQWIEYTPYTYSLEYRPVGGSATQVTGLTDLSYTVSGLNAGVDYEFRVQEVFGTTTSDWSAWSPFTTTTPVLNIDGDDSVADGQTAVISFASGYDIGDATGTVELVTSDGATVEAQTILQWRNP